MHKHQRKIYGNVTDFAYPKGTRKEKKPPTFGLLISLVIFFPLLIEGLTSCDKNDEMFSCDPATNVWATENRKSISSMTRADWIEIEGEEKGRAAYRAFTPEQRYDFWVDKINEVLTLDWSDKEKKHLADLLSHIQEHPEIFVHDTPGLDDETLKFLYLWEEKAREDFKWTTATLYAILATGHKMIDKSGVLEIPFSSNDISKTNTRSSDDCGCSTVSDWCNGRANMIDSDLPPTVSVQVHAECIGGGCAASNFGCGTLLRYRCNGNCEFRYQ